jgi:hypothetical protein
LSLVHLITPEPKDQQQHLKLTEIKEHQKTAHTTVRAQTKYKSKHGLEMDRLEHQSCEAEVQCQHELIMLEHQIQLKNLCRQPQALPIVMHTYGAPPPEHVFDPSLHQI